MLDLGRTFVASVEREPSALAIVDGELRLSYERWHEQILAVAAGLAELGLGKGDHLVSLLQNRWEAATLHWACQHTGIVITPLNWRSKPAEVEYVLHDATARAVVYEGISQNAVLEASPAADLPRIGVGEGHDRTRSSADFGDLTNCPPSVDGPGAAWADLSLMLYTSGTTGRGKGVPRRHVAERSSAVAHVAQTRRCLHGSKRTARGRSMHTTARSQWSDTRSSTANVRPR